MKKFFWILILLFIAFPFSNFAQPTGSYHNEKAVLGIPPQPPNTVLAGPKDGLLSAFPSFRALVAADIRDIGLGTAATLNVGTLTNGDFCTYVSGTGIVCASMGSMTYPPVGVPYSTGAGWGNSYAVGTAAYDLVQLNSFGQLPAVDGSNLTALPTITSLGTITTGDWAATPIAIAYGGTGATSAAAALTALGAQATLTFGTGVQTALGDNVGSAGAFVINGGALGTPSGGTLTNCTFPTLNQSTSGTAAGLSGNQTANYVYAGPASGSAGAALWRALVSADIPNNAANTSGTAGNLSGNQTANYIYAGPTSGSAAPASFRAMVAADLPATAVTGPGSSTDYHVPQWNGTGGTALRTGLTVGTSANNLLQLDSNAKIPAVDGSQLTNLPGATTATAGDYVEAQANTEKTTLSTSYVKMKTIIIGRTGVYRIKFDLRTGLASAAVYGRIYRNGGAVGTEQSDTTGIYVTKSQDITGWTAGDTCELWAKDPTGLYTAYIRNFRVLSANPPISCPNINDL